MQDLQLFTALKSTMSMLGARQKILAHNIANADTPGFVAKDVDEKGFAKTLMQTLDGQRKAGRGVALQVNEPGHIAGRNGAQGASNVFKTIERPNSETTVNGNSVILEEQVSMVAETRMRYEAAAGLYQKSMGLLRIAISKPGR